MPRPEVPSMPNSCWEEELEIERKQEDMYLDKGRQSTEDPNG